MEIQAIHEPCSLFESSRDKDRQSREIWGYKHSQRRSKSRDTQSDKGWDRGEDKDQQVSAGACRDRQGGQPQREKVARRHREKWGEAKERVRENQTETDRHTCHKELERSAQKRRGFRERLAEPGLECDKRHVERVERAAAVALGKERPAGHFSCRQAREVEETKDLQTGCPVGCPAVITSGLLPAVCVSLTPTQAGLNLLPGSCVRQ